MLKRIESVLDAYTGPWQAAYKSGRSCTDIVWCHRMLTSLVMQKEFNYSKMSIDMSSAFDTIKRQTILNLLNDAGCSEDDIRLVRFLLSGTILRVRINNVKSSEFESTLGSFQGDALSGKLFTLTLAGSLNHARIVSLLPSPPISENSMPCETAYADDLDYLFRDARTKIYF